jgi:hypothetical protein
MKESPRPRILVRANEQDEIIAPEAPIQEPQGDKPIMQPEPARPHTYMKPSPSHSPSPSFYEEEYEIAKFFLGGDISVRLVASAPITQFTQKTISKLIKHLELDKADLPVDDIKKSDDE